MLGRRVPSKEGVRQGHTQAQYEEQGGLQRDTGPGDLAADVISGRASWRREHLIRAVEMEGLGGWGRAGERYSRERAEHGHGVEAYRQVSLLEQQVGNSARRLARHVLTRRVRLPAP